MSTGSTGGSTRYSIQQAMLAIRLILANGTVLDVDRKHEYWGAVGVSLGLLGIISTVTFECIPSYNISISISKGNSTILESKLEEVAASNYGRVLIQEVGLIEVWTGNRVESTLHTSSEREIMASFSRTLRRKQCD